MKALDITHQRLRNSRLIGCPCKNAEDVVAWLCAMQSQDYAGAKWALAQRTTDATTSDVDRLFNEGKRVMRVKFSKKLTMVSPGRVESAAGASGSWDNPQKQLRVEIVERVGFEQNRLPPQSKSATFWQCDAER